MPQRGYTTISSHNRGFTLVELLIVIAIIAILAAVVTLLINPIELLARTRDVTRISDLDNLQKAINVALQDTASSSAGLLCQGGSPPCNGVSNSASANTRKNNGTGWVKVNFTTSTTVTVSTLPVDPTNSSTLYYIYQSDGTSYEIDAALESTRYGSKMQNDGGNSNNEYEVGSSLTLLN